jgi:hypothetical protein
MQLSMPHCAGAGIVSLAALFVPAQALAAATPVATTTATAPSECSGTASCATFLLGMLNQHRMRHHLPVLQLASLQSRGVSGCPGSYGHSVAMAETGGIWHTNSRFPRQSFPHNVCVRYVYSGENVGEAFTGDEAQDLQVLDHMMMQEPHSARACTSMVNHACNILDSHFRSVGIGLYERGGTTWLTEDFIG